MKYKIIVHPGEVSGYIAECPAIPGCVSQGKTIKEAMENIQDAIEGCLEVLNKRAERRARNFHHFKVLEVAV